MREKKFLTITISLLILSVFLLLWTIRKRGKRFDPYRHKSRNILVITTGDFSTELEKIPKYFGNELKVSVEQVDISKDVLPRDWNTLAEIIFNNYNNFDSFLILHHPDTIAYSGSALAFILESLGKTVALTTNSILGLRLLQAYRIPEVVVIDENGTIFRACRSKRMKNGFVSPFYPPLGKIDDTININEKVILQSPREPLKILPVGGKKVLLIKIYPGINLQDMVKNQKIYGLVLESYDNFLPVDLDTLKALQQTGTIIVSVSQSMGNDQNSQNNIISCGNMTGESALVKLNLIISQVKNYNLKMVEQLMKSSLRGEC